MQKKTRHEIAQDRRKEARDRTNWAHQRTLLAKERTFSSWGRTGLAALATGLGIAHLLGSVDSPWVARTVGFVLILTSGLIFALAFISYRKALKILAEQGVRDTSLQIVGMITLLFISCTALALVLIFKE